ncbi:MAG TPA: hypothetical protein VMX75_00190 [Spirochaetia bacterium]|nr:hypothetical protein [Spirochaetia bacterium]
MRAPYKSESVAKIYPLTLKKPVREKRVNRFSLMVSGIILLVALPVLALLGIGLNRHLNRNTELIRNLTSQLRETGADLSEIRQTLFLMSQDSNDIRWSMGLPQKSYSTLIPEKNMTAERAEDDIAYFRALDLLEEKKLSEKFRTEYGSIKKAVEPIVAEYGLRIQDSENFSFTIRQGRDIYFTVSYLPKTGGVSINSFLGDEREYRAPGRDLIQFINTNIGTLKAHYLTAAQMAGRIDSLKKNEEIRVLMARKQMSLAGPSETEEGYVYTITEGKNNLLGLALDKKTLSYFVDTAVFSAFEEFEKRVVEVLERYDGADEGQRNVEDVQRKLESVFSATAFLDVLESKGMKIDKKIRSGGEYIHRDILDDQGHRIGSFAIQKGSGEVLVMDRDDLPLCTLQSLLALPEKQKKN